MTLRKGILRKSLNIKLKPLLRKIIICFPCRLKIFFELLLNRNNMDKYIHIMYISALVHMIKIYKITQ